MPCPLYCALIGLPVANFMFARLIAGQRQLLKVRFSNQALGCCRPGEEALNLNFREASA